MSVNVWVRELNLGLLDSLFNNISSPSEFSMKPILTSITLRLLFSDFCTFICSSLYDDVVDSESETVTYPSKQQNMAT